MAIQHYNRREFLIQGASLSVAAGFMPGLLAQAAQITTVDASSLRRYSGDIRGPEGPSLLPDGSIAMVEFVPGNIIRMSEEGARETVCSPGTGIVGTALGIDKALYAVKMNPAEFHPSGQPGGTDSPAAVIRVDLTTRKTTLLYATYQGLALKGPDDIVVDARGDLWFTDVVDGCIYWARSDRADIRRVIDQVPGANGICLSPNHRVLYLVSGGKLLAYDISGRGEIRRRNGKPAVRELLTLPAGRPPDGMRTEASGNIVGGCWENGIFTYSPHGEILSQHTIPGLRVISICFGGKDLRTLFLAALPAEGMTGMLLSLPWPRPGMRLPA